jgi:hypothetical protein
VLEFEGGSTRPHFLKDSFYKRLMDLLYDQLRDDDDDESFDN